MLEKLFTSKTRTKILQLLIFNQNKSFHLRDIARKVKVTPTYVGKELDNLESMNLVKKEIKGNLNLYSINQHSTIFEDIRKIFLKTDYLGEQIRKHLVENTKYAFIFGSFAKGNEREDSDIDLFLISEMEEDKLIRIIQKLEKTIKREINYILWNEKTFNEKNKKGHHLLKTIKKEPIIMIVGDENEFKEKIK